MDNRAGPPQRCTLLEYSASGTSWSVADDAFIGCPSSPRSPLAWLNQAGFWVYMFPSFGAGGVLTLAYDTSAIVSNRWTGVSILDGFGIPDCDTMYNWVDDGYDMITATTVGMVRTYRLHWDTHVVEELPAVQVTQGSPFDFSWYFPQGNDGHPQWNNDQDVTNDGGRRCFIVGSNSYPGLQVTPGDIYNWYMSVWCWDQAHDVWDLALRIPCENAWFNQAFPDPAQDDEDHDNTWYMASLHKAHLTTNTLRMYRLWDEDDDDLHIQIWTHPTSLDDIEDTASQTKKITAATLSFVLFTFLLALIILFLVVSKGGSSSGGGDYSSFNN